MECQLYYLFVSLFGFLHIHCSYRNVQFGEHALFFFLFWEGGKLRSRFFCSLGPWEFRLDDNDARKFSSTSVGVCVNDHSEYIIIMY